MIPDDLQRTLVEQAHTIPCIRELGIDLVEFNEGYCKLTAAYDPRFDGVQPGGFHGGILATVADIVAWFAIITRSGLDQRLVTTDLQIRYLAPCLTDVTAIGRLIKFGRTLCPVAVELEDKNGRAVAAGQVCYMRLDS